MLIALMVLIGFTTSFVGNVSGGAGSLVQLPALLALGVQPIVAIGSIKLGSLGLVWGAAIGSRKKGIVRKDHLTPMLVLATLASIIGPLVSLNLSSHAIKIISTIFITSTAIFALGSWRASAESHHVSVLRVRLGYLAYFGSSTLLAGFGSGIGILSTYILMSLVGMSALEAIGTRRIAGLIAAPLQLAPFIISDKVDYGLGFALLAGSLVGGFLGLRFAINRGNEFVKRVMAISAIILLAIAFI